MQLRQCSNASAETPMQQRRLGTPLHKSNAQRWVLCVPRCARNQVSEQATEQATEHATGKRTSEQASEQLSKLATERACELAGDAGRLGEESEEDSGGYCAANYAGYVWSHCVH